MEKELKIDGPVYEFPLYGQKEADETGIKALYKMEFGNDPPKKADYNDIYLALELSEPLPG